MEMHVLATTFVAADKKVLTTRRFMCNCYCRWLRRLLSCSYGAALQKMTKQNIEHKINKTLEQL